MKLAFWRKKKIPEDPFNEKELEQFGIKRVTKEQVDQIKSETDKGFTQDHIEEIQALNQLVAFDELAKRIRTRKREPFSKWLPPKVLIAWFDRHFSVLHIREMNWVGDGMVSDSWWGRAADVLGPNARPIIISVKGKTSTGFIVDGDRGVGINIERDTTGAYAKLTSTSELIFSMLQSKKISEQFGSPITTRMLYVVSFVVFIMGVLIGHSWK